ncbi:MAG TPA: hypothetical protein VFZ96_01155 [Actinomycetota bacterium]|nr:hypothetical protein [Actinomycetota bacterium]
MSDERTTHEPTTLPPPPAPVVPTPQAPPVTDTWAAQAPQAHRRPVGLIVGAVVVVLALVAGFVAFASLGGDEQSASAQPLSLVFAEGENRTYTLHMTMDGQLEADEMLGGSQALEMDMTQTMTLDVVSVNDDGVATVRVTIEDVSGSVNGIEMPESAADIPSIDMQIAPDGRVLTAGGLSFAGFDQTGGAGFPGMGQMTPLLPDGPVEPGDTWTEEFSQDIPFGEGSIEYTATNTLERYEDVEGVEAAVVTSSYTVPMDFRIDFDELLESMGGGHGITGATGMAGASISYVGEGSFVMTSWVAREAKELLKMSSSGSFDMTMAFGGVPGLDAAEMAFAGDFTYRLSQG